MYYTSYVDFLSADILNFNITPGPYTVGQTVLISCEIQRIRGSISKTNLQISIGDSPVLDSIKERNVDGTHRLSLYRTLVLTSYHDKITVNCKYNSPNGTYQERSVIIPVISDQTGRKNIIILYCFIATLNYNGKLSDFS